LKGPQTGDSQVREDLAAREGRKRERAAEKKKKGIRKEAQSELRVQRLFGQNLRPNWEDVI